MTAPNTPTRTALVTGGASGIGRGIVHALTETGVHTVVADVDHEAAATIAAEAGTAGTASISVACDVRDRSSVEALAEQAWAHFGHVDMVFNNAGILGPSTDCITIDETSARAILDVNLIGVWHGCSIFGQRFIEQGTPANIINTASENGIAAPVIGRAFYTASKHAVVGLSDVLRQELPDHITVSVFCPGIVASRMTGFDGIEQPPVGLGAEHVGRHVVTMVAAGEFYIVTHPPVAAYVQERAEELAGAFARQAPRFDGDNTLDTRALRQQAER